MADWLETAFRFSARWTRFDPNDHYARRNGENIRLIFIHNGSGDFAFGGKQPFIGLRDLKNPLAGSEDWFGWLAHELSHDFWPEHPAFQRVKEVWGEGMCDYERYSLLLNMDMPEAARHWNQSLQEAHLDDRSRGGAWMFLRFQRSHSLDGPAALWDYLWDRFRRNSGQAPVDQVSSRRKPIDAFFCREQKRVNSDTGMAVHCKSRLSPCRYPRLIIRRFAA